ncbi:hypothetical protein E2562_038575 [Oryza meyeriana var. granulata]|uniref:Uncharacterized protein n=1 Tax=Oryza meyeriana var. granulata TaxID=110450 RepID=A0A6G1FGU0_9ORYZ|nr:hypothetical protein E2562_038575 [Oryza meyeriana var. granulata]
MEKGLPLGECDIDNGLGVGNSICQEGGELNKDVRFGSSKGTIVAEMCIRDRHMPGGRRTQQGCKIWKLKGHHRRCRHRQCLRPPFLAVPGTIFLADGCLPTFTSFQRTGPCGLELMATRSSGQELPKWQQTVRREGNKR